MLRVESSQVRDIVIKRGLSKEEIISLVREWQKQEGPLVDKVVELSRDLGTTLSAARNFFRILGKEDVKPEKLLDTLADIAERHVSLSKRLAVLRPEDEGTRALVLAARAAINDGDYPRADQRLKEAETAELGAVGLAEELERQAHDAGNRRRRSAAAILAERGELALTQLNYLEAAEHFEAASELIGSSDVVTRVDYLNRCAGALFRHGTEKDSPVLKRSITVFRRALSEVSREQLPQQWATTQNNLGLALQNQGTRTGGGEGAGLLAEAVTAYRAALEVRTREQLPQDWAMTQNNLGNALVILGAHNEDVENVKEGRRLVNAVFEFLMQTGQEQYRGYFEERIQGIDDTIIQLETTVGG